MKVILYLATSINGYIARKNDSTGWSEDEWSAFSKACKEAGNLVIGRKTLEVMLQDDSELKFLDGLRVVVLSSSTSPENTLENVSYVQSPAKALELLKTENFPRALIGGGSKTANAFIQENLIDEIYLDFEPKLFGAGIPMFPESELELDLNFIEVNKTGNQSIQVHYSVKK